MFKRIKEFKWGYILLSAMLILSGLSFFVFKETEGDNPVKRIAIAIGIILLVYAVLLATATLASKKRGFKFAVNMIVTVCALVSGLATLISPEVAEVWIVSVFGLLMTVDGSFKLQTSILSKRYKMWLWLVILVLSVTTIVGGFVCTNTFGLGVDILSIVLGVTLMLDGVSNFLSAFYISSYEKRMKKEYADEIENKMEESEK